MSPNVQAGFVLLIFGSCSVTFVILWVLRRERTGGLGRVPPPDPAYAAGPGDYELEVRGSARINGLGCAWPEATLLISRDQIELRAGILDTVRVARAEVTGLRWVPWPFGPGLKFRTESGRLNHMTIWTGRKTRAALAGLGWY
jgi:hypothetical protein